MKLKELLFLLSCIVFVVFCLWYAVSEFGKSLDGFKSVEEVEVNKRDGSGKIYIVQGRWNDGTLVPERGNNENDKSR